MRVDEAIGYNEPRDCLAQDWWTYLLPTFLHTHWMALPNIGDKITKYVNEWSLDGVILTGGNDVGSSKKRDETEAKLLEIAVDQKIPVLGVCRGLQMVNIFFGGSVIHDLTDMCGKPDAHVAKNHTVLIEDGAFLGLLKQHELEVNSYHRHAITTSSLAPGLMAFAMSPDGIIEGICHTSLPIIAIQWHPERKNPAKDFDRKLINAWLEKKGF